MICLHVRVFFFSFFFFWTTYLETGELSIYLLFSDKESQSTVVLEYRIRYFTKKDSINNNIIVSDGSKSIK